MAETTIRVTLCLRSALHLGSGKGDDVTDDLLRRNAQGDLMIPGSSIAGSLRATLTRLAPRLDSPICQAIDETPEQESHCDCWTCQLFGDVNPQEGNEKSGRASMLWIYDAFHNDKEHLLTAIRDGVGIARTSGAAARQGSVKFNLEVLPAGTTFTIVLKLQHVDDEKVHTRNLHLLALALEEWRAGRGTIGGRVARGLGTFTIEDDGIVWHERDLNSRETLMSYLKRDDNSAVQSLFAATQTTDAHAQRLCSAVEQLTVTSSSDGDPVKNLTAYAVSRSWLEIDLTLFFDGPMLINSEAEANQGGFDHAPLSAVVGSQQWILPGSSLRGVLRSQAERIARTLATHEAANQNGNQRDYFLAHNPAGDPNQHAADEPLANSDALLTASGLDGEQRLKPGHVDLADRLFGSVRLGSRLTVEDGQMICQAGRKPTLKAMDFVAIDRFTGGARDSAKFDAVALWQPTFSTRIRLENPTAWELGWLLLTLRDLADGLSTIGYGRAKGFGGVQIEDWNAALGFLQADDFPVMEGSSVEISSTPQSEVARTLSVMLPATETAVDDGAKESVNIPLSHSEIGIWTTLHASKQTAVANTHLLTLANHWVMAFNHAVQNFERISDASLENVGVPYQNDDSYFDKKGLIPQLYPIQGVSVQGD